MGNLLELKTHDSSNAAASRSTPLAKRGAIPINPGQLHRFVRELKSGDIVVFPLKRTREI
jgi:predicted Mrr-cat superfamily restriction endonuclease